MNNKGLTISILIVGGAVFLYYYTRKKAAAAATNLGTAAGQAAVTAAAATAGQIITEAGGLGTPGGTTITTQGRYNFTDAEIDQTLSKGSSGRNVKALQLYLIKKGVILPGGADGIFGTNTENALMFYLNRKQTTLATTAPAMLEIIAFDEARQKVYLSSFGWGAETEL